MNIGQPAIPQSASACLNRDDLVGVALLLPLRDGNPIAAQLFHLVLEGGVRAKGIEPGEVGGLFGADFTVWTVASGDRNSVLRAIEQVLKEAGFWDRCEVAFYDKSEAYWRTTHPYGAAPFDRFLSQPNIDAAKQRLAADEAMIRALMAAIPSAVQTGQGGPSER